MSARRSCLVTFCSKCHSDRSRDSWPEYLSSASQGIKNQAELQKCGCHEAGVHPILLDETATRDERGSLLSPIPGLDRRYFCMMSLTKGALASLLLLV